MIERFLERFSITSKSSVAEDDKDFYRSLPVELYNLFELFGGTTFNNGLYHVHSFRSSTKWALIVAEYYNQYLHKIYPFGFDWMGRQFCLSTISNNLLFMFDPATGESFELQQSLLLLHDEDFVNDANDMLSVNLFNKVLNFCKMNGVGYNECMGLKIPLFLGGKARIENYELQDIEVYWHIYGQLYNKTKDMSDGTKIGTIKPG